MQPPPLPLIERRESAFQELAVAATLLFGLKRVFCLSLGGGSACSNDTIDSEPAACGLWPLAGIADWTQGKKEGMQLSGQARQKGAVLPRDGGGA